jgi:hypothetical protein
MNESRGPELPQGSPAAVAGAAAGVAAPGVGPRLGPSIAKALKRFLACNPCYLVSAALLLYGIYRVSMDLSFLSRELAQLFFNFTSLQFYEALVVVTAIVLARRRIWYDSTLLVGLENLLVLVPFLLVSQAALIDTHMVWTMCLAAGLVALARFGSLKRFIVELNFPRRLVRAGLLILAVNVALPIVYRVLHEYKFGTKPTWGAAYHTNEYIWWLVLPVLFALLNLLGPARQSGRLLLQHRWLPCGSIALWLAGSVVHLSCLGYVYDFTIRPDFLAPALWTVAWTFYHRLAGCTPAMNSPWRKALLVLPFAATLVAVAQPSKGVFLMLTAINLAFYGSASWSECDRPWSSQLVFVSLAALVAGIPEDWGHKLTADFHRAPFLAGGAAIYCLLCALRSRDPRLGLLGSMVFSTGTWCVLGSQSNALDWSLEMGLVFLLLHSLRWPDAKHVGAATLRILAGMLWVAHAWVWMHTQGSLWMTCVAGAAVLGGYLVDRLLKGGWGPRGIPLAAVLVLLAAPGDVTVTRVAAAPVGLLAVVASFLFFGLGTVLALTRHRWNRNHT